MDKVKAKPFRSVKSQIFYIALMVWPVIQFLVFYIGVNVNSFMLAFKEIDANDYSSFTWSFAAFKTWFTGDTATSLWKALLISLKSYAISLFIGVPLGILFAYYIFKKKPGAMIFRILLFMPSIITAIVLVTIYSYFTNFVYPEVMQKMFGVETSALLSETSTRYGAVMFYNLFVSFGTSVLLYSNKMSNISPEMLEAAELDGANEFQEFFRIVLPQAYSTISVFLITGIAGIFTNEINNFSFFNYTMNEDTTTIGFLMYYRLQRAKSMMNEYPPIAALGLMTTVVVLPLTFLVRHLLEKYGPKEE